MQMNVDVDLLKNEEVQVVILSSMLAKIRLVSHKWETSHIQNISQKLCGYAISSTYLRNY